MHVLRYCEAISNCIGRSSPYTHNVVAEQLRELTARLVAAPHLDKSGSWIGGKMPRPSLDKVQNWVGDRLMNFIAGQADSPDPTETHHKDRPFGGPFAHYSTISSATPSNFASPHQSTTDLTEMPPTPPYRTGSAMAVRSQTYTPINRSSSAMDFLRKKASPVPRVSSANAVSTVFPTSPVPPPPPPPLNGYASFTGMSAMSTKAQAQGPSGNRLADLGATEDNSAEASHESGPRVASWWGSEESSVPTPTASAFTQVDTHLSESAEGFVSLMDDPAYSMTPTVTSRAASAFERSTSMQSSIDDDEEDLGFGNSRPRNPVAPSNASTEQAKETSKDEAAPENADAKTPQSGGWFSRLWKREATTPGPVKANLGEEVTFYYDKELKRWVNKTAGAKPTAPPPPLRAQTASPSTAGGFGSRPPSGPSPAPPPPVRPATAIDLNDSPPKTVRPPVRVRSNLVPTEIASAPTTPASATMSIKVPSYSMDPPGMDGPPTAGGRVKTQGKRNLRSRYVDVFQQ